MKYIITIDAGTTNTRVVLLDESGKVQAVEKRETGVRKTAIDGNNRKLKQAVKECIAGVMDKCGVTYDAITIVIASGMITSNVGLVEVPHIPAPAGIEELAKHVKPILLEEVCPVPIWFIPGVKNTAEEISLQNYEKMDIMRGEEAETIAVIEDMPAGKPMVLVLPGSHTKFVAVDENKKITGCLTSITGELLAAVTNNTILADAVDRQFVENYEKDMVLVGYENAKNNGLGRACFSCRILNQFVMKDPQKLANYLLGAVLESDLRAVQNSQAVHADKTTTMIVAGKNPLRQAIVDILEAEGAFGEVIAFSETKEIPLSCLGACLIAKKGGLMK